MLNGNWEIWKYSSVGHIVGTKSVWVSYVLFTTMENDHKECWKQQWLWQLQRMYHENATIFAIFEARNKVLHFQTSLTLSWYLAHSGWLAWLDTAEVNTARSIFVPDLCILCSSENKLLGYKWGKRATSIQNHLWQGQEGSWRASVLSLLCLQSGRTDAQMGGGLLKAGYRGKFRPVSQLPPQGPT